MNDELDLYSAYNLDLISTKGSLRKTEILTRIKNIVRKDVMKTFDLALINQGNQSQNVAKVKSDLVDLIHYILREFNVLVIGFKAEKIITNDDVIVSVIEILQSVMPLNQQENDLIKASINFIVNNKLIKKVATHKRVKKFFSSLLKKVF